MTKKAINFKNFKVDAGESVSRRLARLLDWAAEEMPGRSVSYQEAAKIVLLLPRLPGADSREVESIKSAKSRSRKILLMERKRGLVATEGIGIRATTDDDDLVENQVEVDARRVVQASEALDRSTGALKAVKIKNPALKSRFSSINKASRLLINNDVLGRLRALPEKK